MIRDSALIDKLIADLHFHNFLHVVEGDNIFTNVDLTIENLQSVINAIGLDNKLNARKDFYHGGNVQTTEKSDYINTYLDDVFIDYFFRTYKFKEIIFPKGLCHEQITPEGIVHPKEDISLDLNNLYDRCTFANNIFRLFGIDSDLKNLFPSNKYIKSLSLDYRIFGLHSWCFVLIKDEPIYKMYLDNFVNKYYPGHSLERANHRGQTIKEFVKFVYEKYHTDLFSAFPINHLSSLQEFEDGFSQIQDEKIFGQYTIEEILLIYALLTDKFLLHEDSFLLTLCFRIKSKLLENSILNDFIYFEDNNMSSKSIEPYINSKDMYLRFASHTKSKAYTFKPINDVMCQVDLFGKPSVKLISHSNTMPLPFFYKNIT